MTLMTLIKLKIAMNKNNKLKNLFLIIIGKKIVN